MHTHRESDCILFVTGPARTFIYDLFLSFTVVTKSAVYYILSFFCLYLGYIIQYTTVKCEANTLIESMQTIEICTHSKGEKILNYNAQ